MERRAQTLSVKAINTVGQITVLVATRTNGFIYWRRPLPVVDVRNIYVQSSPLAGGCAFCDTRVLLVTDQSWTEAITAL